MKKKLMMCLSVALIAVMAICGTLAYLTSEDSDVNVMTLGNVDIEQNEHQRVDTTKAGTLTEDDLEVFEQGKPLLPYVDENLNNAMKDDYEEVTFPNGLTSRLFIGDNAIDKMVSVTNTGKTNTYVRTIIALEAPTDKIDICFTSKQGWTIDSEASIYGVEIDGVKYDFIVAVYNNVLAPGETTPYSLLQFALDWTATNEDVAVYGETYDIPVFTQAVQAEGFSDAKTALNTAFGPITADNHPWKDAHIVKVNNSETLAEAVKDAKGSTTIVLEDGNYTTNFNVNGGKDITIVGSKDAVLSGQIASTSSTEGTLTLKGVTVKVDSSISDQTGISQTGKSAIALWGNQTVVCEGVTFDMSLADSTAITSWWDTGVGTSIVVRDCIFNCNGQRPIRATGNVTVENTTFNDPYRYAVQLTAKSSTATEMNKAIVNFNNNTIVNGENGKDFVYGIQLEGETYGCYDCVINGTDNTIENGGTDSAMYYCECGKVDHNTVTFNTETTPVHNN